MMVQKICKHPPCNRSAQAAGWCNAHYIRNRNNKDMDSPIRDRRGRDEVKICIQKDCGQLAKSMHMCNMHYSRARNGSDMTAPPRGQKLPCQQVGCDIQVVTKGYCRAHYHRYRNGLDMLAPIRHRVRSYRGAACKQDDCDRPARAKGWCQLHWDRTRNGIPMDAPVRPWSRNNGICQYPGCNRMQASKSLCQVHYQRQWKGGDMDAPVTEPRNYDTGLMHKVLSTGYVEIRVPDHFGYPKARGADWYDEHRYVMECHLGRALLINENVHHINGDRADNRQENLELWTTYQPAGQRVTDLLNWADTIIARYGAERNKLLGHQLPLM